VIAQHHYCIPPLERPDSGYVLDLIRQGKYFSLHAPRQTGKTSVLKALQDILNSGTVGDYRCLYVNLECAQTAREDVGRAMMSILDEFALRAQLELEDEFVHEHWLGVLESSGPDGALMQLLAEWSLAIPHPLVLLVDEIDALVGDTLISVLRQLRSGYESRPGSYPQSVILCGVRDPQNYRIHTGLTGELVTGGSAFNISAASLRLGDFDRAAVDALLGQHTAETGQEFEPEALECVWTQTQGQPWLVNALCAEACFEDPQGRDRSRPISEDAILAAQEVLIRGRVVHLDQLTDKLREERVQRVIEPLLSGAPEHCFSARDCEYVRDLGLVAPGDEIRIANPIYAEVIPRELTYITQKGLRQQAAWYVNPTGSLDSGKLMAAFQQYFREHVESWLERFAYKEAGPQLLLQAFLQRIVSGEGRIVREYGLGRERVDLLVLWSRPQGIQRIVIECKVRRGSLKRTLAEGLEQTARYMDGCAADAGHLVIFDRSQRPWKEKVFHQRESVNGTPIEVWGM